MVYICAERVFFEYLAMDTFQTLFRAFLFTLYEKSATEGYCREKNNGRIKMTHSIRTRLNYIFGLAILIIASMPALCFAAEETAKKPALYATGF